MSEWYSDVKDEERSPHNCGRKGGRKNSEQMPEQLTKAGITFLTINIETAYHAEQ